MFPTPVGMNRALRKGAKRTVSVPHTRGDEPNGSDVWPKKLRVFPTPVGMNLSGQQDVLALARVPHTRGDEPLSGRWPLAAAPCSPHPWG